MEFDPLLDQNQSPTRQAPMQDIARADEYLCFKFSKASVKMRRRVIGVIHGNDDAGWVGPLASEGGQELLQVLQLELVEIMKAGCLHDCGLRSAFKRVGPAFAHCPPVFEP